MSWSRRSVLVSGGVATLAAATGCYGKSVPIGVVDHPLAATPARRLIVMLPGFGDRASAFAKHDMIKPVRESELAADVIAVEAHFGYYRDGSVTERVSEDVLRPARERYDEVWLMGISMGGFGSMFTASKSDGLVDGLFVLAPFLGRRSTTEPIRAAGGLAAWERTPEQSGYEFDLWSWLRGYATSPAERPRLWLAYGDEDDGDGSKRLLADALPAERVFVRPGGHKWAVWHDVWPEMLAAAAGRA